MAQELNLMKRLTIDEIINHSLKIYGKNFLFFILILAIPFVPAYIFLALFAQKLMLAMGIISANAESMGMEGVMQILRSLGQYSVGMLVYCVLLVFAIAAMVKAASDVITQTQTSIGGVLNHVLSLFFPILLTSIIAAVIVVLGFPFCMVPSLILAIYLTFIIQAVVIEDRRYFRAVGRSFQFVKGHFGSIFLLMFIYWILYSMISSAVTWGFMMGPYIDLFKDMIRNGGQTDPAVMTALYAKISKIMVPVYAFDGVLNILLYPLLLTAITLKFHNVRNLKEGTGLIDEINLRQNAPNASGK